MKPTRWSACWVAACGLALAALSGCQTWVPEAGVTLPSGRYLEHPPQFIPPSPPFPLTRELAAMEAQAARAVAPGVPPPGALPPPVALPPGAPPGIR